MPKLNEATQAWLHKADIKVVSDNPEWTKEDFARAKPFSEVFSRDACQHQAIARASEVDNPKQAVTLRLSPDVVERFKAAAGDEWRASMANALKRAKV